MRNRRKVQAMDMIILKRYAGRTRRNKGKVVPVLN
jgi:hypothetical protein